MKDRFQFVVLPMMYIFLLIAVSFSAAAGEPAVSQPIKIDVGQLLTETQKRTPSASEATYVWWIPNEYWEACFQQEAGTTKAQIDEFLGIVDDYTIFAIVDGKVGSLGGITFKPDSEVRECLSLSDAGGVVYRPLSDTALTPDAKNLFEAMAPIMANAIGAMGKNLRFYVFDGSNKRGERLLDPKREGTFTVKLCDREFRWKLPLGSLLPARTCPKCNEELNGAYKFCPWDGNSLIVPAKN